MLIEVELVVDLGGSPGGKPLLEKYNARTTAAISTRA